MEAKKQEEEEEAGEEEDGEDEYGEEQEDEQTTEAGQENTEATTPNKSPDRDGNADIDDVVKEANEVLQEQRKPEETMEEIRAKIDAIVIEEEKITAEQVINLKTIRLGHLSIGQIKNLEIFEKVETIYLQHNKIKKL